MAARFAATTDRQAVRCFAWNFLPCSPLCPPAAVHPPGLLPFPPSRFKFPTAFLALKYTAIGCVATHGRVLARRALKGLKHGRNGDCHTAVNAQVRRFDGSRRH